MQKKSNLIGFSRRLARKKTRQSTSVDDVYEFKPEKVRRSKVALRLTKGELAELGRDNASDSEGDNNRNGQPQPRLIGQNSDDEGVDSEEDEDIDSDAAFGESDEETFAGHGFVRKVPKILILHPKPIQSFAPQGQPSTKPKQKPPATKTVHFEVNLDESDGGELEYGQSGAEGSVSEMEAGEPGEFFDVLDILDGRADPLSDDELPAVPSRENGTFRASSDGEEEEEEADDDGDDQDMDPEPEDQFTPSDDEADVDGLQNLGQFISNLDSPTKRKIPEGEGAAAAEGNAPRKKRKLLKERNEAGAENEFAASGELQFDPAVLRCVLTTWSYRPDQTRF